MIQLSLCFVHTDLLYLLFLVFFVTVIGMMRTIQWRDLL
jgi:hypothetical protein